MHIALGKPRCISSSEGGKLNARLFEGALIKVTFYPKVMFCSLPMLNLLGQIALVTGGSQGIGSAIALALAERGANVAVMARSLEKCEAVAAEIRKSGGRALSVQGDVAEAADVQRVLADVAAEF